MKRFLLLFTVGLVLVAFLPSRSLANSSTVGMASVTNCCKNKGSKRAAEARRKAELNRIAMLRRRAIAIELGFHKETADNISKDKTDGEDPKVRAAALAALGTNAGTVVVMETKTGKVLTIVNQDWGIRKSFQPCSTIKLVTTVAGLKDDIIGDDDELAQDDLEKALANSKNPYFQKMGLKIGYPELIDTAEKLGLGKPTGINVPGENPGKVSLVQKTAKVYSHGYGFEITPLQQAVLTSIIANHGLKVTPYIPNKNGLGEQKPKMVNLPVKDLDGVIPGMKGSAQYGTAHRGGIDPTLGIAGKTGTCQATGTFTSFGPISDPQYTVVVIVRGSAGRGRTAAGVASKIYQALLENELPQPHLKAEDFQPDRLLLLQ